MPPREGVAGMVGQEERGSDEERGGAESAPELLWCGGQPWTHAAPRRAVPPAHLRDSLYVCVFFYVRRRSQLHNRGEYLGCG